MSSVSGAEPRHPPVVSSVCTDHGVYSGTLVDPISANIEQGQHRRHSASSSSSSVTDTSDPAVRRVVYNLYRGLLGTYNDKANDIISAMPPEMVREDHGIAKHIESMIRQSEEIKSGVSRRNSSGNTAPFLSGVKSSAHALPLGRPIEISNMDAPVGLGSDGEVAVQSMMAGPPPPPPPPPPPMPSSLGPSNMPAIKINAEIRGGPNSAGKTGGGKHVPGGGAPFSYIPPSAIQNAMMTKDKKPFTYTPGGIDFLAEIRSPRMQRRISKNAADEGVSSHPHQTPANTAGSSPTPSHLSPQALMAMQPQMAVPVFPPTPQQMPVLHSPALHLPVTPPTPTAVATSPNSPVLPSTHQNYSQQQSVEPPPPPQPLRVNLKPAVPQFLQSQGQTQSPEQMFEEIMNSLSARNAGNQTQSPIPAPYTAAQPVVAAVPVAPSVPTVVASPERRNTQLGSIYIPPVNNSVTSASSNTSNNGLYNVPSGPLSPLATAQLAKAPMPWMNSQNRPSSSPNPTFVNNQQQQQHERVIPVEREENVKPLQTVASGNVRVVPIAVEGAHAGATVTRAPPAPQRSVSSVKDETVHPPWHNAQGKVIPIYMESSGPGMTASVTPVTVQRQPDAQQSYQPHQQAPWRTQAAANANQIASMMEELMMSPTNNGRQQQEQHQDSTSNPLTAGSYSRAASVEQPRGQPTQSRSFRILQMIHDPADDPADAETEPTESSGRLSRSSVGSNNSGGTSGGRVSQHSGPPPVGERRLNLTQDDRELMDMFRSQVNEEQSLHQEVDPRYRGSHIPSRAFRILQNFTATDSSAAEDAYQHQQQMNRAQANNPVPSSASGATTNINRGPPSEQSEPEPKKYMGGNIPSRSFRMLQAMTSLDPNADMERVFMTSRSPELIGRSDSVDSGQLQQKNGKIEDAVVSIDHAISSPNQAKHESHQINGYEPPNAKNADELVAPSSNPTPSILIDNYEEEESQARIEVLATAATDQQSEMNTSDHSVLTHSGAEVKRSSDQEVDIDTESETTHHHSRLLRLLSGDLGTDGATGAGETGALSATTSTPSASETEANFMPPNLPGVRLRIRSLRAKDRIPSRVFRSLQHEFDSSTEDITQAVISSPPPFSPNHTSQLSSAFIGQSGFFRYSRLYASVTPETPSSATSELDGFFSHHQNHLH